MSGLSYEDKIETALSEKPQEKAQLMALFNELSMVLAAENAHHLYLLGYLLFHIEDKSKGQNLEAIQLLRKSLFIEPNNEFAKYYLGFLLFDIGKVRDAYSVFLSVNREAFENLEIKWRSIKVQEMIWCCRIEFAEKEIDFCEILNEAVEFFYSLKNNVEEEEWNYPLDIIRTTYHNLPKHSSRCLALQKLSALMKELDLVEEYPLEYSAFISNP